MEKELILDYIKKKGEVEEIELTLSLAKKERDKAKQALIDHMTDTDKDRTASYDGIGSISMVSPTPRARVLKENEDILFQYLTDRGRTDMIKQGVHHATLSSYVSQLIEEGECIPDFIEVYMQPNIRVNSK